VPALCPLWAASTPAARRPTTCAAGPGRLAALGFAEAIHFAFHERAADAELPALARAGEPLALANPLSERYAVMRRSLVPT